MSWDLPVLFTQVNWISTSGGVIYTRCMEMEYGKSVGRAIGITTNSDGKIFNL